ncbi:MAG: DNA alkylation repair protein [Saprospiraceae bacterium]|nr:DNA alkylation repair protein [Saprospiraceae bacterium]
MAELLKNIYNERFFSTYCDALQMAIQDFDRDTFLENVYSSGWISMELKQRISHLALYSNKVLPADFSQKIAVIEHIIQILRQKGIKDQNLEFIFFPEIILTSANSHLSLTIKAIEIITSFTSFEFAVRPLFVKYPDEMMAQMMKWSIHENQNVRRFASEGCRPRLPWGIQLKHLIDDPTPIIPLLENLRNDPSEYVRKSVANNLNDISKDHTSLVINLFKKWKGDSNNTDRVIKHGARTLLKKGDPEVLELFGHSQATSFAVSTLHINKRTFNLGEPLIFNFEMTNESEGSAIYRIEYIIYFIKSNGKHTAKKFKISEPRLESKSKYRVTKKHHLKDLTTRKHYSGTHKLGIVINGLVPELLPFDLMV